ncbi:MAG: T9SS type A sorting domain-containing protein [Bacteroidetes bacterium]|nr:T9SS type A sorting domain-containing protein [Bacteroidota bacterium]
MNKIYIYFIIFLVSLFAEQKAIAQKEGNIWCFGAGAGIDFNSGSPVFFPGVAMNQWEGVSSIANANGQLLFYSDGITVWNRNHVVMPNGSGLTGGSSSTQSALIVKQPGANPNYYLFSAPEQFSGNPLNYSVIDTTLQGGLGDVTLKNISLHPVCDERVSACLHSNGTDVWILSTTNYGDTIVAYLLSSSGMSTVPVVSYNGLTHTAGGNNQIGYLKTSPSGDHLAIAYCDALGPYELYDFDIATGQAGNPLVLDSSLYANAYGVEFSPDGTRLYGASHGAGYLVFQFDLTAGSPAAIKSSATLVATASHGYAAALQLAPDGKIYLSQWTSNVLGRFDNPNGLGLASSYDDNAFTLPSGTTNGGLPNLLGGIFFQSAPIAIFSAPNHICPGTCTSFNNLSINATSFLWTFTGANPTTSTDVNPTNICYNTPGTYPVSLIATNANGSDTITLNNYITVYAYPAPQGISQSGDTLFANAGAVSYQWYHDGIQVPGATDYFYVANESGNYNVVATDANGCEVEAVIFDVIAGLTPALSTGEGVTAYPNPVKEKIYIRNRVSNAQMEINISIYNILGEKILTVASQFSGSDIQSIDVASLPAGMYWMEALSGKKVSRTNFIKAE